MAETSSAHAAAQTKAGGSLSWRQFKAIIRKDVVMELRTKEMLTSMGLYTLLTMVIYQVALSQTGSAFNVRLIAAGLLWLSFTFTSLLGLNRSLVHEKDQGVLDALLLSPIDRPIIFFAKAVGNLLFLMIVELISLPVFWFLFLSGDTSTVPIVTTLWQILLALVLGSIGIAGVGTLLATMSVNTTGKDFVLALLFIPLMYPLLLPAVSSTSAAILGGTGAVAQYWQGVAIMGGYDAIMLLAAFALYEFIIGA